VLEILIDASGRVVRARVIQSVPLLDAAAVETMREWTFAPAIKQGRPVATLAQAPITFRIYQAGCVLPCRDGRPPGCAGTPDDEEARAAALTGAV
jgi:TonB family protein